MKSSFRIAIVGDIHDQWDKGDHSALEYLQIDLVLFVGDFGNEVVPIVEMISHLSLPKAVILGNHDAWFTASEWGRKKAPYDRSVTGDRVQQQLDLLGKCHVGYGFLDFPELGVGVVGGRPFSWGGSQWKNGQFYTDRFGVDSFQASSQQICDSAQQSESDSLIFLSHNGPLGLGELPWDPCGKDWKEPGGDYGDPDLQNAIVFLEEKGKNIPLVAFGHMHHRLKIPPYKRKTIVQTGGRAYVNAACVPRWQEFEGQVLRNFTVATLTDRVVTDVKQVWITDRGLIVEMNKLRES